MFFASQHSPAPAESLVGSTGIDMEVPVHLKQLFLGMLHAVYLLANGSKRKKNAVPGTLDCQITFN